VRARRLAAPLLLLASLALPGCANEEKPAPDTDLTRSSEGWRKIEAVRLLQDYVRIDTTDTKGEWEGALLLRDLLDCVGIETEIVCPAPRRCNLLARLPGRKRAGALLLLNHIDVVHAFAGLWKEAAPFEGKIKFGFLYGRGAYDMKSLGLAEALALRALKMQGVVPESDILFLAESDEEGNHLWGSRWLLEHRPDWFAGVAAVLNEGGTNEMILRDPRFFGVETVQAGYGLLQFEAGAGTPLEALARRWPRLEGNVVDAHPHAVLGFEMLANHLVPPLTDLLRHLDRVRGDPQELAQLPDRYGSFLEPRIQWSAAYPYPPQAPDSFRAFVVVSTPPGVDPGIYLDQIERDARGAGVRLVSRSSTGATVASPYPSRLTEILERVTEAYYPGVPFGPVPTFGGETTSIYFRRRGIPAYGYSPIPFNITDSARRHGNDERIYLRDYLKGIRVYADVVAEYAAGH
jgi:acetylornithine deacetylase/succinyl-diaminopimelate desuccinylase-like protein